ncbi:MAG: hypothetical protein ACLR0I_08330 [Streptococcus salivarius]
MITTICQQRTGVVLRNAFYHVITGRYGNFSGNIYYAGSMVPSAAGLKLMATVIM